MNISSKSTIGEIVAKDYRFASIFKKHGIDFCCKGSRTLEEVCEKENIHIDQLTNDLDQLSVQEEGQDPDFKSWDSDLLADYIEKKHHRYVLKRIPELKSYLNKIASVHGDKHPELFEIEALFNASAIELIAHMEKEERIVFPYVRQMAEGNYPGQNHFGSIRNPIQEMMNEHDNEGERFRKIASLSNNYTAPEDGCATYKIAFEMLKEFEDDLHKHIHLENNILFPKAIAAEKAMNYA